jgi:TPR repeat protein
MASFEEKVEALRRLRERRQVREEPAATVEPEATKSKEMEGQEFVDALSQYAFASLQEPRSGVKTFDDDVADRSAQAETGDPETEKAAQEASALYCLGHCYEQGLHECEKDEAKAAMYYQLAAEKGNVTAQWRLGHLYEFGLGIESSDACAAHWYRLAAEAGCAQAQSSLALFLEDGRGCTQDDVEALQWHLAAAEQNEALSQYCAACCLAEGRGAKRNEIAARSWLKKSADAGFPPAREALSCGLQSFTQRSQKASHKDGETDEAMVNIAERLAKQLQHLSDEEASAFLDDVMGSLHDSSLLDVTDLKLSSVGSDLGITC